MKTRTLLLTLLLFTGITFQHCSSECECCFDPVMDYFDIEGAEVYHLDAQRTRIVDNSIDFEDYGYIDLRLIVEYIALQQSKVRFSLMNSALACSPPVAGVLGSKEEVFSTFNVYTVNDFDDNHKAGESLNDILEVNGSALNPIILSDYLDQMPENVPMERFFMKLLNAPTLNTDFQVRIEIEFTNGESYEVTSDIITYL